MKLLLPLLFAGLAAAQEVPQWVRLEAARQAPTYPAKVSSVVLLHEEQLTVAAEGHWAIRERGVIRILQPSQDRLQAARSYDSKAGRIRDFRAWLLRPGGAAEGLKQVVDVSLVGPGETYDEARARTLDCPNAPAGSVFAFEIVEEEKTSFTQYLYSFQDELPVLVSRFVLSLPAGWEVKDTMLNHPPVTPSVDAATYTWELRDLPWIEREDYAPPFSRLAAHLGVTFYPAGMAAARPLKDWPGVSAWASGFVQPAAAPSGAVRAKSGELAKAGSTLEKIQAIASFAQKINYVSVQMNVARGGGYTPHPPEQVLARNYGDCKDKAALMKALLDGAGIESYVTLAYSRDARHVRPDWPSPAQFNHAIVAIRVGPEIDLPSVAEYPRLGRLLFFDPTDPYTGLGDLPANEQGSHMLVLAGAAGELVRAPKIAVRANRVESTVEARMDAAGALTATLDRQYYGQPAASMRATVAEPGKDALRRVFEAGFAQRIGGVTLHALDASDRPADSRFDTKASFEAKEFGQIQGKLLLLKPGSIVPGTRYSLPSRPRQWPIELRTSERIDKVRIRLPEGFKVDEVPDPVEMRSPYGVYEARYRQAPGFLIFEQSLEEMDIAVPPAENTQVREFFSKVAGYQQAAVVMVKE
jgi:transglutaminase-like putative cysteine protease